jgi:uncharacterized protein with von Willebrand factor type A (vWA) domain
LAAPPEVLPETAGRLAENIVHFTRALRKSGVRVGPSQVESTIRAVAAAGFTRKVDFYHTLRAVMINRPEDLDVFHQVFAMFWRDPEYLEKMMHLMSPTLRRDEDEGPQKHAAQRRAAEALTETPDAPKAEEARETVEVEAQLNWSANERLMAMDFEAMSAAEAVEAERAVRALVLPVDPLPTRRLALAPRGRVPDIRATLRGSIRRGGEIARLEHRAPTSRPPDLVALVDISGSMASYSRVLMHFLHALAHARHGNWGRVSVFTMGTRLTNVTRALSRKDPDAAMDAVGREAEDWQGGTLLGDAIERFNKDWSRRVLGQGAVTLLVSDGLERAAPDVLSRETERLAKSCRSLIWMNPLLRYSEFTPEAGGIRAILPHADRFLACHSLASLRDLAEVLGIAPGARK